MHSSLFFYPLSFPRPFRLPRFALAAAVIVSGVLSAEAVPTPPLTATAIPEQPEWVNSHPRVIFDKAEVARIRRRIAEEPEITALWQKIKEPCDSYVDPKKSTYLDSSKAFDDYLSLKGGTHEKQGKLEGAARRWLTALDALNFAYAVTGDERYGKKAAEIALAAARKLTPETMKAGFLYTETFPTRSMALTLDWCYPLLTSDERQTLRESLVVFANELYYQSMFGSWGQTTLSRIWNWNGGIASTWGLAAIVLEGETHAPTRQWLFQAERNAEDYVRFGIDEEGAVIEGPSYFGYGAGYLPYFVEALKARTGEDLYASTNYHRLDEWLPLEVLPGGGRVNNLMDSGFNIGFTDALLYALHRDPDRARARWLWEYLFQQGNDPSSVAQAILWAPETLPAETIKARVGREPVYGWAGGRSIVISRDGWDAGSAYFSIHAQQYTVTRHDQADKGQFTFYADGDDLVIDSGYGNDSSPEKSTSGFAHNQVMVDGHPEIQGNYHAQTDGWIMQSLHTPLVDLSCLDVADSYRYFYPATISYQKQYKQAFQRADRQALFVRTPFPYAIVFDDVKQDDNAHDYTWMLHAKAGKEFVRTGNTIGVMPAHAAPEIVVTCPTNHAESRATGDKWMATLQLPKAGKYRVYGLTGTGYPDGGKADSFFLRINGGKQGFAQGSTTGQFIWATASHLPLSWVLLNDDNGTMEVPALDFPAGPVQIELSAREFNADCAAIALIPESAPLLGEDAKLPEGTPVVRATEGTLSGAMQRELLKTSGQHPAWLQVGFVTPDQFTEKTESFLTTRDGAHPRLSVTARGTDGQFLAVLVPHHIANDKPEPATPLQVLPARKGRAGRLTLPGGLTDLVAGWDGSSGIAVENIETDAELLWLRRNSAGKIVAASASNLTHLSIGGQRVFASSGKTSFVLDDGKAAVPEGVDAKFTLPDATVQIVKVKRPAEWYARPPK